MPKNLESRLRLDLLYSMKSTDVSFIIELKKWFDERVKVMEAISEIVKETSYESVPNRRFEEIAKQKMPDLNAASLEAAMSMVKGTARSMGIVVAD